MRVKLFLNKDVNSNANFYFDKAKKLKKKIPGVNQTIERTKKEIENFEKKKEEYLVKREREKKLKVHRKKEWYDKFRSTFSTNGFLIVIGKDATSNEVLIKKHMEDNDMVLHTEAPGSPFGLIKGGLNKAEKSDIEEAMQFICCFSSQWKRGFGTADGFWVESSQISKTAESGEFMSRGSFMIRGKKNILKNINLRICLGVKVSAVKVDEEDIKVEELFSGSESACKKYCLNKFIKLEPGDNNYKALTREIKKRLRFSPEDLPKYIPNDARILKR